MDLVIESHTDAIADRLVKLYPVARNGVAQGIREDAVDAIADELTSMIAEILQAYLDAGSERDVTHEELGPAIRDHVAGWTVE